MARLLSQLFPERVTSVFRRVPGLAPAGHRRRSANRVFDFQRSNRSLLCRSLGFSEARDAVQAPPRFAGPTRWYRLLLPQADPEILSPPLRSIRRRPDRARNRARIFSAKA